jgi:uracil-DNA glycosylase
MDGNIDEGWVELASKVRGQCAGCPRNSSKVPVLFDRSRDPSKVDFLMVSQEPGHWLRPLGSSDAVEKRLMGLCMNSGPADELKKANPLSKAAQMFGGFDPANGRIYWTHALKCLPVNSDRDVNKEWRKAAMKCREHFIAELRLLGRDEINVIAFGKYALEMCLNVFDGQDIDQELSISEFMQSSRLPLFYKYRFKDGAVKNINLFVFTNPSAEVVKVMKSGGKMTTEEIQDLEAKKIGDMLKGRPSR